jgi:hypothetical protein
MSDSRGCDYAENSRWKSGLIFGEIADGILRGVATTGGAVA